MGTLRGAERSCHRHAHLRCFGPSQRTPEKVWVRARPRYFGRQGIAGKELTMNAKPVKQMRVLKSLADLSADAIELEKTAQYEETSLQPQQVLRPSAILQANSRGFILPQYRGWGINE